jgi:radical SAM superfamily enzyme YgiQ (UPF0313 family)
LLYLASPLKKKGFNVSLVDLNVEHLQKEELINLIKKQDFILITCYSGTINNVKKIIKIINKVKKQAIICCGGPYCNTFGEFILGSDLTCLGEAEGYIVKILNTFILNESLEDIPGIIYHKNEKLVKNQGIMKTDDLDTSLLPFREIINKKKYGFIGNTRFEVAVMMTSRGCPFNCNYCSFIINTKVYRERSVENVILEIKSIVKLGYKYIGFGDDNFLVNKRRVHKIMDAIIEEKFKVNFFIQGRVDSADYELYMKLRKARVIMILFGIESANQDILDYYNKRTTVEKAVEAVKIANNVGILTLGSFIIGAPFETRIHFDNNKEFFDKVPLDLMYCNILTYFKGSKLWDQANKNGIIKDEENTVITDERFCNFSSEELSKIRFELIKHFYRNPKRLIRSYSKIIRLGQARIIFKALSFINWVKDYNKHY